MTTRHSLLVAALFAGVISACSSSSMNPRNTNLAGQWQGVPLVGSGSGDTLSCPVVTLNMTQQSYQGLAADSVFGGWSYTSCNRDTTYSGNDISGSVTGSTFFISIGFDDFSGSLIDGEMQGNVGLVGYAFVKTG